MVKLDAARAVPIEWYLSGRMQGRLQHLGDRLFQDRAGLTFVGKDCFRDDLSRNLLPARLSQRDGAGRKATKPQLKRKPEITVFITCSL